VPIDTKARGKVWEEVMFGGDFLEKFKCDSEVRDRRLEGTLLGGSLDS